MRSYHSVIKAHLIPWLVLLVGAIVLVGAGCSGTADQAQPAGVQLEPVSYTGANPFTPPVGNDQSGVTPPSQAGGTFPGDTVGLYGGSARESVCEPAKLVAYLQENPAKAAAWASVLGIVPADIPAFVASLTPVVLRSDTRVTNHGFDNGAATAIPAVLQAGTAVLVDAHGFPVTKCFCGNPLTAPAAYTSAKYVGPQWPTFVATSVTVIVPVSQVVNQFTLVAPGTGDSFQRPPGTTGGQDGPVTTAPPQSAAPTPPPATTAAPPTAVPPTTAPPPAAPTAQASPPPAPPPPPPPAATQSAPVAPTPAPPSPSPSAAVSRASWVIGDCYVAQGRAHAVVLVATLGAAQTFTVSVRIGPEESPYTVQSVQIATTPSQLGRAEIIAPAAAADGPTACAITSIVDENGGVPIAGDPLPPPPDTRPGPPTPSQPAVPSEAPIPPGPGGPSQPGGPGDLEDSVPPGVVPAPS